MFLAKRTGEGDGMGQQQRLALQVPSRGCKATPQSPPGFLGAVGSAARPAVSAGVAAGSGPRPAPPGTPLFPGNVSHPESWRKKQEE